VYKHHDVVDKPSTQELLIFQSKSYDPYGSTDLLLPFGKSPVNKKPQKNTTFRGHAIVSEDRKMVNIRGDVKY
jgi:hypothetical protein